MRKLTVYVVFRLNYNRPDSNLHLLVSFETRRFHYDFTMWRRGARARVSVQLSLCCRFPTLFTLIRPPGNQFSLDSAFLAPILHPATGHSPPGSASIQILLTRASGAISCVVDSRHYLP